MIAIYKRELAEYFHNVVGFLFVGVMIFFFGLYANVYHFMNGYSDVSYSVSAIIFLFVLAIPVLSMRILAEEKKQKTDQLILTAPISIGKIVIGKYLAMCTIFLIPSVFMCVVPLFLRRYGEVPLGSSYVGIFAFVLYGFTCIAVGLFVSSITESQVIAAVVSFGILFVTYMMSGIESIISSTGNTFTKILSAFDFDSRFSNLTNGVLDLTSVVYFVTVIALLLFLTIQSIQKRRYNMSVKNISMGAYSTGSIAIAIVVVVLVNMVVTKLPTKYTSFDITSNKLYTITDQTKELLSNLSEEINIYVIASKDNSDTTVGKTLELYEAESSLIKVTYVDPLVSPTFIKQYTSDNVSRNSIVVESSKRFQFIDYNDLYETEINYNTYQQEVTGYDAEGKITSAISYVTTDDMPKVYMISGHDEYDFDNGFIKTIEKENITYETISLMEYDAIPEDAKCVIINAPDKDFSSDDAKKVIDYLNNGGKVFACIEYSQNELTNYESIFSEFGMTIQKGYAIDTNPGNYYQNPLYLLPEIQYSTETSGLTGQYSYILAPYAQGIEVPENTDDITYTKILTGSDSSLVKTNLNSQTYDLEEGDFAGPICYAAKAEKTLESGSATLYAFTSFQMFTDNADSVVSGTNNALFGNIMSQIADHTSTVSIPVKSYGMTYLTTTAKDSYIFLVTVVAIIPLALIIAGLVIWLKRRKK